jgi:hypothetical protein
LLADLAAGLGGGAGRQGLDARPEHQRPNDQRAERRGSAPPVLRENIFREIDNEAERRPRAAKSHRRGNRPRRSKLPLNPCLAHGEMLCRNKVKTRLRDRFVEM